MNALVSRRLSGVDSASLARCFPLPLVLLDALPDALLDALPDALPEELAPCDADFFLPDAFLLEPPCDPAGCFAPVVLVVLIAAVFFF